MKGSKQHASELVWSLGDVHLTVHAADYRKKKIAKSILRKYACFSLYIGVQVRVLQYSVDDSSNNLCLAFYELKNEAVS